MCREPRGAVSAAGLKGGVWDIGPGSGSTFSGAPGLRISWGPPTVRVRAMFYHQCFLFSPALSPACCCINVTIEQHDSPYTLMVTGRMYAAQSFFPKGHYMIVCINWITSCLFNSHQID